MADARGKGVGKSRRRSTAADPRTPDVRVKAAEPRDVGAQEFFSALTRSLDALQRQLANANNSFADFVVKEFKLETPLTLSMNSVGAVRFLLPDDNTRAELLTRMTMVLTPVAKAPDAASAVAADDQRLSDLTPITETAVIPREFIGSLLERDIRTVGDFLGVMADARFSVELASMLRVDRAVLGRWTDQIRLQDVGKLTTKQLNALTAFDITNLAGLAALTTERATALSSKFPGEFPATVLMALIQQARSRVPSVRGITRPEISVPSFELRPESVVPVPVAPVSPVTPVAVRPPISRPPVATPPVVVRGAKGRPVRKR